MVIVDKSLDDMLEEIEFLGAPIQHIMLFESSDTHCKEGRFAKLGSQQDVLSVHLQGYINYFLFYIAVEEALSNAYFYGNQGDNSLQILLTYYSGVSGGVVRIEDQGEGFNFEEVQARFKRGKRYFSNKGGGFRYYNNNYVDVAFEEPGNVVNIKCLR